MRGGIGTDALVGLVGAGIVALVLVLGFIVSRVFFRRTRVRLVTRTAEGATWTAVPPLKIAMDANCLRTARTGVRTYADELIARFTRPDAPHKVTLLRGPARLPSRVRLFRILNQVVFNLWQHIWLPLRLRVARYDVLFCPDYLTPVYSPVATVVMFHDAMFLRRPQDYNPLWQAFFRRLILPAIRRADAVLVPSTYTAEEAARYGGIAPERIYVVPEGGPTNGEPLRVDPAAATQALARFGVRPREYALHVGVLERRKNLPMLIRGFAAWRARGGDPDFKLVLAGQPGPRPDLDDRHAIDETIRTLGLEGAVVLTGHVSRAERDALYTSAALVAVPSRFEGFGLPVLEAFSAQVPVLCSRVTSLPEVAGDAALLFDPDDPEAIAAGFAQLTGDAVLRERLVRAGNERLRAFSWEHAAAGTFAAFEEAAVHRFAPRGARPHTTGFTLASEQPLVSKTAGQQRS